MDVHTSKQPVHGWRAFLGEVGIIVLGVLIALGAEQAVQSVEWGQKVDLARKAMRWERGSDDAPEIYQRAVMHPCLLAKLDEIRAAVEANRPREAVVGLTDGYKMQFLSFDSVAHANATASDVATHMPARELAYYTDAYSMMPTMDRTNAQEARDIARLHALRRTGGPLSEAERDRLLEAVETLRGDELIMWGAVRWSLPAIHALGIEFDPLRMKAFTDTVKQRCGACIQPLRESFWVAASARATPPK